MTNLDREAQEIQKPLAKPQIARLKHKWSKKERNKKKGEFLLRHDAQLYAERVSLPLSLANSFPRNFAVAAS
jgi:hypothetical protein